MNRSDKTYV